MKHGMRVQGVIKSDAARRAASDLFGPSVVLIRSSMCHEICLHDFMYKDCTDFAQSGLKMIAIT